MSGGVVFIIYTLSNLGKQSKIHGHYGWLNCHQLRSIIRNPECVYISALMSPIKNKITARQINIIKQQADRLPRILSEKRVE